MKSLQNPSKILLHCSWLWTPICTFCYIISKIGIHICHCRGRYRSLTTRILASVRDLWTRQKDWNQQDSLVFKKARQFKSTFWKKRRKQVFCGLRKATLTVTAKIISPGRCHFCWSLLSRVQIHLPLCLRSLKSLWIHQAWGDVLQGPQLPHLEIRISDKHVLLAHMWFRSEEAGKKGQDICSSRIMSFYHHPWYLQTLCSMQKYSSSWRRVQLNVGWNCLATACAVGNILFTLFPLSASRFSFLFSFLLSLLAGKSFNGPSANFL